MNQPSHHAGQNPARRFIFVEDEANRRKLQAAAFSQPKVAEAPVVLICCGDKQAYRRDINEILDEGICQGVSAPETKEKAKQGALQFPDSQNMDVWSTATPLSRSRT